MTIQQAHKEFQLFLDKVDSQVLPDILPNEIDVFLHEAEVRLVKSYLPTIDDQRKSDKISHLLKTEVIDCEDNKAIEPEDYLAYSRSLVRVNKGSIQAYVDPTIIPQHKINSLARNPFNKTRLSKPLAYMENKSLIVMVDGFTVDKVLLTYYKYPRKVSKKDIIDSELSESLQKEAIALAIVIALEAVESQRTAGNAGLLPTTR